VGRASAARISAIAQMKQAPLIVIFFLLFGQVACWKKKTADSNTGNSSSGSLTTEGDRSQARSYLDQGQELYRADQDEKAAEAFQQAIKSDPELAEAYFRLGLAYDALGREKEAEDTYKKAIEKY
jgi:tetratricopeptide (TPR) repeat protein